MFNNGVRKLLFCFINAMLERWLSGLRQQPARVAMRSQRIASEVQILPLSGFYINAIARVANVRTWPFQVQDGDLIPSSRSIQRHNQARRADVSDYKQSLSVIPG